MFPVERMCALLGVSRSGYYQYLKQKDSNRKVWQQYIIKEIKQVYDDSKRVYGRKGLLIFKDTNSLFSGSD